MGKSTFDKFTLGIGVIIVITVLLVAFATYAVFAGLTRDMDRGCCCGSGGQSYAAPKSQTCKAGYRHDPRLCSFACPGS